MQDYDLTDELNIDEYAPLVAQTKAKLIALARDYDYDISTILSWAEQLNNTSLCWEPDEIPNLIKQKIEEEKNE